MPSRYDKASGHPPVALHPIQPTMNGALYIPISSPPTPAPSPGPIYAPNYPYETIGPLTAGGNQLVRRQFLTTVLASCTPEELLFISASIAPRLKRDFLVSLPAELALYILSFVDDPRTLTRASQVTRYWRSLVLEEFVWKRMCAVHGFMPSLDTGDPLKDSKGKGRIGTFEDTNFSYRSHFKASYITMTNWRKGGNLLRTHRIPVVTPESGVVTSLALDADWVVIGLANSKIQVYSATTGVLAKTLVGHDLGVWSVALVSKGGWRADDPMHATTVLRNKLARLSLDNAPGGYLPKPTPPPDAVTSTLPASLRIAVGLEDPDEVEGDEDYYPHQTYPSKGVVDEDALEEQARLLRKESSAGLFDIRSAPGPSQHAQHGEDPSCHGFGPSPDPSKDDSESLYSSSESQAQAKRKYSDMCYSSQGWGQPSAIIVSGGCDKAVMVWDALSGQRIYRLSGHTSTIRCIRVLQNRPIAISGSRDSTLRVWDIQRGKCLRVLRGHQQSVRCLDACGNRVVSGSYDTTCRIWDVDTGECLHILNGHFHQIYSVAFDGRYVASGGLDTTVRLWDANTGECKALLQGHTALVCQLQLSPDLLITGGSDGRVITFSLETLTISHRIAAHDCSVTSLQFVDDGGDKDNFLVTGGNDGRVRLYEVQSGNYVREISEGGESVWRVIVGWGVCVVVCKRSGTTVVEIWSMRPSEGEGILRRMESKKSRLGSS